MPQKSLRLYYVAWLCCELHEQIWGAWWLRGLQGEPGWLVSLACSPALARLVAL